MHIPRSVYTGPSSTQSGSLVLFCFFDTFDASNYFPFSSHNVPLSHLCGALLASSYPDLLPSTQAVANVEWHTHGQHGRRINRAFFCQNLLILAR